MSPLTRRADLALNDQTLEAQLLGALLAVDLMKSMLTAGLWIFNDATMMSKIASLSAYPDAMAYAWMALTVGVIPYFGMQAFGFWHAQRRQITRLACRVILASGVLWMFLAYLSKNVDSEHVTIIFILNSITFIAMSAILASSINTAQEREAQQKHLPESQP